MKSPHVLLVEGKDDYHSVLALANHYQLPAFDIVAKDGINNLLEALPTHLKASDLKALGILVDADTDLPARWHSLHDILMRTGYLLPERPDIRGTVVRCPDLPAVGIWLMPNNQFPGILEDFVAGLVPVGDALWRYAQHCVDAIPVEDRRFPEERVAKARIHTWLAWQEEPGKPIGQAITARYLDPTATGAAMFVDWMRRLFEIE